MLGGSPAGEGDEDLLTEVSALYYQEGETQEEISRRFGLSRAKVGRLLKKARDLGIVEVTLRYHPILSEKLEARLIERFGIRRALIALDHQDPEVQRAAVAGLVSRHLAATLQDGMVATVGMGRNIAAIADHVATPAHRSVLFVCAIGGSLRAGEPMNSDHICRRLAARFGGEAETLYAPANAEHPDQRERFMANETVRQTLDKARRADVALIGIGDLSEDSNMVRMGWFAPKEIADARARGTVGDLMGYDFVDINGRPADTEMQWRVIGLTTEDLRRIPNVIAIASESSKALAILGALRTGVIDTLATSVSNVHAILGLDDATRTGDPGTVPDAAAHPTGSIS